MSEEAQDVVYETSTNQSDESEDSYDISLLGGSPGAVDTVVSETSHSNRQHTGGSSN